MKPVGFPQSNTLLGDNGYRSETVADIASLPVWTDGEMCWSCWRMSWRDRLSALLFGRVWLGVLSGGKQPPVAMATTKTIFGEEP